MPSIPSSAALTASSRCCIPFSTIGPFQCFFRSSRSSQVCPFPEKASRCHVREAATTSSSISFLDSSRNIRRKTGSEKPTWVPTPFTNGKYPLSRSQGRHASAGNDQPKPQPLCFLWRARTPRIQSNHQNFVSRILCPVQELCMRLAIAVIPSFRFHRPKW